MTMKKLIILTFMFTFNMNITYSQCKYKKEQNTYTKYCISDSKPTIDGSTPYAFFYGKGGYIFAKSGDKFYLYLHLLGSPYSSFGTKIDILESNPLIIKFENGEEIKLFPNGKYTGKNTISMNYVMGCYYLITQEQLAKIIQNKIINFKYHLIAEKQLTGMEKSDGNSYYYNVEINSKKSEKIKIAANCILSFKL